MELEEARAAVGPAVELGRHRSPAHAPNRCGSSDDGRMVGAREHVGSMFSLVARRGDVGPGRRSLVLVAGWAIERMFCTSLGRGSVSYRFLDSVDAQTCCPFLAFNLTSSSMRSSPRRVKSSHRGRPAGEGPLDPARTADGPSVAVPCRLSAGSQTTLAWSSGRSSAARFTSHHPASTGLWLRVRPVLARFCAAQLAEFAGVTWRRVRSRARRDGLRATTALEQEA